MKLILTTIALAFLAFTASAADAAKVADFQKRSAEYAKECKEDLNVLVKAEEEQLKFKKSGRHHFSSPKEKQDHIARDEAKIKMLKDTINGITSKKIPTHAFLEIKPNIGDIGVLCGTAPLPYDDLAKKVTVVAIWKDESILVRVDRLAIHHVGDSLVKESSYFLLEGVPTTGLTTDQEITLPQVFEVMGTKKNDSNGMVCMVLKPFEVPVKEKPATIVENKKTPEEKAKEEARLKQMLESSKK